MQAMKVRSGGGHHSNGSEYQNRKHDSCEASLRVRRGHGSDKSCHRRGHEEYGLRQENHASGSDRRLEIRWRLDTSV